MYYPLSLLTIFSLMALGYCAASPFVRLCQSDDFMGSEKSLQCRRLNKTDPTWSEEIYDVVVVKTNNVEITCYTELLDENRTLSREVLEEIRNFEPGISEVRSLSFRYCNNLEDEASSLLLGWGLDTSSVRKISLEKDNKQFNLSDSVFENFTNLEQIRIRGGLNHLQRGLVANLKELKHLDLLGNFIQNVSGVIGHLSKLDFLQLGSNSLEAIDDTTFQGLVSLHQLNLESNQIVSIHKDAFKSLKNLAILGLSINNLTTIPASLFADNFGLQDLGLARNSLKSLPATVFGNLRALTSLDLYENPELSELHQDLFENTTSLLYLKLNECKFSKLPANLFRNLRLLKSLDLSHNMIDSLSTSTFIGLHSLETLKLGYNRIQTLDSNVFWKLPKLRNLQLRDNHVKTIDSMAFGDSCVIEEIDLSSNMLTFDNDYDSLFFGDDQSPLRHCRNLKVINLSRNNLSRIQDDWLYNFNKLTSLNLSYNNITKLDANSLNFGATGDIVVDLRNNSIENINLLSLAFLQTDPPSKSKTVVKMGNNPMICDCASYSLASYMNGNIPENTRKLEFEGVVCHSPVSMSGFPLTKFRLDEFVCVQTDESNLCLAHCDCTIRPADKTILAKCRDLPGESTQALNYDFQLNFTGSRVKPASLIQAKTLRDRVVVIDFGDAEIRTEDLHLNWTLLRQLHPRLRELRLNSNLIQYIPNDAVRDWNGSNISLALGDNPYTCGCENRDFHEFVNLHRNQISDLEIVLCNGRSFIDLRIDELCPYLEAGILAVVIVVLIILLFFIVAGIVMWRFRRTILAWMYSSGFCLQWIAKSDELEDEDKPYDAFVSFSHKDEDFVLQTLVPALEEPADGSPSYRLCLHYRDWLAGEWIPDQIARSVASAKRTIVVLSPYFLESVWGQLEFRTAYNQVLKDKRNRLVVVVKGALPSKESMDEELRTYLSLNTYLKWEDPWFWERLRYALPHKKAMKTSNLTRVYLHNNSHCPNGHKDATSLNKGLAPLPLSRSAIPVEISVPPEIELNLTPTSSVGSGDPIFPQEAK